MVISLSGLTCCIDTNPANEVSKFADLDFKATHPFLQVGSVVHAAIVTDSLVVGQAWRPAEQMRPAMFARSGLLRQARNQRATSKCRKFVKIRFNGGGIVEAIQPLAICAQLADGLRATQHQGGQQRYAGGRQAIAFAEVLRVAQHPARSTIGFEHQHAAAQFLQRGFTGSREVFWLQPEVRLFKVSG